MITDSITMIKLTAAEGHTLRNGETLAKVVYLGKGADPAEWTEITDEEAAIVQAEIDKAREEAEKAVEAGA